MRREEININIFNTKISNNKYQLKFTLATYDWLLPDDLEFYKVFKRSLRNSEMHIFSEIQSYQLCDDIKDSLGNTAVDVYSIPCELNLEEQIQSSNQLKTVSQSSDCRMLLSEGNNWGSCKKFEKSNDRQIRMKEKTQNTLAKLNASLSKTNPNLVNLMLKEQHTKWTELEKKTSKFQE